MRERLQTLVTDFGEVAIPTEIADELDKAPRRRREPWRWDLRYASGKRAAAWVKRQQDTMMALYAAGLDPCEMNVEPFKAEGP